MARHVELLRNAVIKLEKGDQSDAAGTSSSQASQSVPQNPRSSEDLARKVEKNGHIINHLKQQVEQMERKLREDLTAVNQKCEQCIVRVDEMEKNMRELEARMCNGVFLWRIKEYMKKVEDARRGIATAVHSMPFYTGFYGYKLCLR